MSALERGLELAPPRKGANFVVWLPDKDGVLDHVVPIADGIAATSPVQTYLDLTQAGEGGCEGADHLRATLVEWPR